MSIISNDCKRRKKFVLPLIYSVASLFIWQAVAEAQGFLRAAKNGDLREVKLYLIGDPNVVRETDKYGRTALHLAAQEGHIQIVKLLLDSGADINAKGLPSYSRYTPLAYAATNNHLDVAKLLLECGADVEGKAQKGELTPLLEAAFAGKAEAIKLLIENKANINVVGRGGWTPLHEAVEEGRKDAVKMLLQLKAKPNIQDSAGRTPLFLAVEAARRIQSEEKLPKTPDVHYWGENRKIEDYIEIGKLLLASGANPNVPSSENKYMPLHEAVWGECRDFIELLVKNGADINLKDKFGNSPSTLLNIMEGLQDLRPLFQEHDKSHEDKQGK